MTLFFLSSWMFLVSMPPAITVRGINIYFPSFFLFKLLPEFRVYARAGVFVLLGMTIIAGYGLKVISVSLSNFLNKFPFLTKTRIRNINLIRLTLFLGLTGLVLFENLNLSPAAAMDVEKIPQVYQWLRDSKEDLMIIEYPKDNSGNDLGGGCPSWLSAGVVRDYNRAYEIFYFRVHQKKLFGFNHLEPSERALLSNLADPMAYALLKNYGVTTVVIHTRDPMIGLHPLPYPQENPLDECWRRRIMPKPDKVYEKFIKVAEFSDGIVYKLE